MHSAKTRESIPEAYTCYIVKTALAGYPHGIDVIPTMQTFYAGGMRMLRVPKSTKQDARACPGVFLSGDARLLSTAGVYDIGVTLSDDENSSAFASTNPQRT